MTEIYRFVGLASYYLRLVKGYASIVFKLSHLTQKEVPFQWTDKCKESFLKLKTLLTIKPILALLVEGNNFVVSDVSHSSLGAILM